MICIPHQILFGVIKSRRVRLVGHVAREERCVQGSLPLHFDFALNLHYLVGIAGFEITNTWSETMLLFCKLT
jgi:hypothetical protein